MIHLENIKRTKRKKISGGNEKEEKEKGKRERKREADAEERDGGEKSFISLLCYSRIRDLSNSLK